MVKWATFTFPPINLYIMPPTQEMYNIIMERLMAEGFESLFENQEQLFLNKLVSEHWNYIQGVLVNTGAYEVGSPQLKEIGYHYNTAMKHGWRHAKEYFTGSV